MTDTTAFRWQRAARAVSPPLILAAIAALVLSACGGAGTSAGSGARSPTVTVVVHHGSGHGTATAAAATDSQGTTAPSATAAAPAGARASGPPPTTIAVVKRAVRVRSKPSHSAHVLGTLTTRTQFGSATSDPVVRHHGAWLGVRTLLAGNGGVGWVPRSAVRLTSTRWRIYVSIARQRITVAYGNRIIKRYVTSTGAPGAATPTGHFAVTDRLTTGVEHGPYGCCILALSAVQPLHLSDWDGGNRIAIHATDDVADLGHPASHGCAHVDDADGHWLLSHIPNGTPVTIENAVFHRGRGSPA